MSATLTGAPNVAPPSNECATKIAAFFDGTPAALKVGPTCQVTNTSPSRPKTGTELCCKVPALPQFATESGLSGPAMAGPSQVSPPTASHGSPRVKTGTPTEAKPSAGSGAPPSVHVDPPSAENA